MRLSQSYVAEAVRHGSDVLIASFLSVIRSFMPGNMKGRSHYVPYMVFRLWLCKFARGARKKNSVPITSERSSHLDQLQFDKLLLLGSGGMPGRVQPFDEAGAFPVLPSRKQAALTVSAGGDDGPAAGP